MQKSRVSVASICGIVITVWGIYYSSNLGTWTFWVRIPNQRSVLKGPRFGGRFEQWSVTAPVTVICKSCSCRLYNVEAIVANISLSYI